MSCKWRCTGEEDKRQLWLVLLFNMNLCLFTVSMILLRPVGVFVVDMLMELEGVVVIWGDMRMQLPIRGLEWFNEERNFN